MTSRSACFTRLSTARCSSAVVSTRWAVTPNGSGRSEGPDTSTTSAPRAWAASAMAYPMRPLDGFVTTRTGSRCSRVGPAVTTTFLPSHGARCSSSRAAAASTASGSLIRPGRSLGPSASGPVSGPTKCHPRPASVFTLARVAGWAYMASFMAGAASTAPVRARSSAVSRSSASPRAARASRFAVAGPTINRSAAHQLVERAGGELLLEIHRTIARELVYETGELGGHEDAQILVLCLRGHFARGHDPHHLLLPVD